MSELRLSQNLVRIYEDKPWNKDQFIQVLLDIFNEIQKQLTHSQVLEIIEFVEQHDKYKDE